MARLQEHDPEGIPPNPARRLGLTLAAAGSLLVLFSSAIADSYSPAVLLFVLWALVPYVLLVLLSIGWRDPATIAGAGVSLLAGEIGFRLSVFVFPRGSTAAIALIFSPGFLALVALPAGAVAGWLVGRAWRVSKLLGGVAGTVLVGGAVLFSLSLARPELTPWALREKARWIEQLGDGRVVEIPGDWERIPVPEADAWVQTDELDGEPGDELALVDHHEVLLLDPWTLEVLERRPQGSATGSQWNWFSRLARFEDRLVTVQTGGGYQETEVLELDGRRLWRYRPSADLPPSALRPGDVDGDARTDLIAIDGSRLVRLDQEGRELWSEEIAYSSRLLLAPRARGGDTPWIVTYGELGVEVRDGEGQLLGSLALRGFAPVFVAELAQGRRILSGEKVLSSFDFDGTRELELGLGELSLVQAVSARLEPGMPPYLAVVAAAPRDVERWRVAVLRAGPDLHYSQRVYEEITERPPSLLVAGSGEGAERLFLQIPGGGLWRVGPI